MGFIYSIEIYKYSSFAPNNINKDGAKKYPITLKKRPIRGTKITPLWA
jgi:hypothetical protein